MLERYKTPFIYLTNGGGLTEADQAAHIGQRFGLELSEAQIVQSHMTFRTVVPGLQDAMALILGGVGRENCKVA